MRSPMLAAQHRPPCRRSPPGPARLCSAPPARRSARSACAAVAAPPPRAAAAPRAPGTPPARRPAARAVTHRATRVMHSRARELARQRHTLPHCHSHTPGLWQRHTHRLHMHTLTVSLMGSRRVKPSNCHKKSLAMFSSLESALQGHSLRHTQMWPPIVSYVVTHTVYSALQGDTL